jgi:hypothetical protein
MQRQKAESFSVCELLLFSFQETAYSSEEWFRISRPASREITIVAAYRKIYARVNIVPNVDPCRRECHYQQRKHKLWATKQRMGSR